MSRRHTRLSVGAAVWFALVGLIWWQYPVSGAASTSNPFAAAAAPAAVEVTMTANRFNPGTIRVAAGATVIWRNTSDVAHTVTGNGFVTPAAGQSVNIKAGDATTLDLKIEPGKVRAE